jgi:hypothetical protein
MADIKIDVDAHLCLIYRIIVVAVYTVGVNVIIVAVITNN